MAQKEDFMALAVKLSMDSAEFKKGIDGMNRSLRAQERRMNKMTRGLRNFAAGFGAAFSARALVQFGRQTLSTADNIGKMSRVVGLTAETFQELSHAAELSGINASLFESSMTALVKRTGEAKNNMGPLVTGLKGWNEELLTSIKNSTSQEQVFNLLSEAMEKAGSAAERAAIANAAFGRSGIKMTELMGKGTDAIDKMRKTTNTMSNESIAAAERMNDVWTTKMNNIRIGAQEMAISFIDSISRMMTAASAMSEGELERSIAATRGELEREYALIGSGGIDPEGLAFTEGRIKSITDTMMGYVGALSELQKENLKTKLTVDALKTGFDDVSSAGGGGGGGGSATNGLATANLALAQSYDAIKRSLDPYYNAQRAAEIQIDKVEQAYERLAGTMHEVPYEEAQNAVDLIKERYVEAVKAIEESEKKTSSMAEAFESSMQSFADGFSTYFIDSIFEGKRSFEDLVESVVKGFAKMILQQQLMAAFKPAGGFLGGLFGFADGGVIGGGSEPRLMARGGVINQPTLLGGGAAIGGEAGPEVVAPLKRGKDGNMGVGASPTNIVINNNSSASVSAEESTGSDGSKQITFMIEDTMRKAFGNGSFDRSMSSNFGTRRPAF